MKTKPTLTVGIPAYNEEANIGRTLKEVLSQKQTNYNLRNIVVYSDASTDKTNTIVKALSQKHPLVKIKVGKKRIGKYLRVGQAFSECKTEFLVILDADIMLESKDFLSTLIQVLVADKKANMVSARNIPLRPDTFIGKTIYTSILFWDNVRISLPDLSSAENFFGTATAYRGSFAQKVKIPKKTSDPHLYIFLMVDRKKGFRYCIDAFVYQWPIATIRDYNKFLRRTLGKEDPLLRKLFGKKIDSVYGAPQEAKIKGAIKTIKSEPLYFPLAILLIIYGKIQLRYFIKSDSTPVWDIVTSTKKEITYAK
jgi:glycosyltransferase involved in cell wall biosynthesis